MFSMFAAKSFLRYSFLPEISGRMSMLFMNSFAYIPYFLALVYQLVRLLPSSHPYLNPKNIGRFGVRHVIVEAARNIKFSLKNLDQILLFGLVLVGVVMLTAQLFILLVFFVFKPAMALPVNWNDFFQVNPVANRRSDLAFMMLDMVFGVPHPSLPFNGFFESCIGAPDLCVDTFGQALVDLNTTTPELAPLAAPSATMGPLAAGAYTVFPFPFHIGLHALFAVYSTGLLVVAVIIASYFIVTILAETAQSGTAFGRRFNKTWAPIRIVVAFGLLMPMTVGLNSSQYIVLYAAKWGSAFATNGWNYFNDTLTESYLADAGSLISRPNLPDLNSLTHFMYVARACEYYYELEYAKKLNQTTPYTSLTAAQQTARDAQVRDYIDAWVILEQTKPVNAVQLVGNNFNDAVVGVDNLLNMFDNKKTNVIQVVFGNRDQVKFPKSRGYVKPLCGQLTYTLVDTRLPQYGAPPNSAQWGVYILQNEYLNLMIEGWDKANCASACGSEFFYAKGTPVADATNNQRHIELVRRATGLAVDTNHSIKLDMDYINDVNGDIYYYMSFMLNEAVYQQTLYADAMFLIDGAWSTAAGAGSPLYRKGWAGAGIWYNRVSELNGTITTAVNNMPVVAKWPEIMEKISSLKVSYSSEVPFSERFKPDLNNIDDSSKYLQEENGQQTAQVLYKAYNEWGTINSNSAQTKVTGNIIYDGITMLLGANGLYDMRRNSNVHPLAQLAGVGRALVESAIRNLGYATVSGGGGIILGELLGPFIGKLGATAASLLITIAMMQLTIGFVMYYVLPFLPFIYFFFAVGGWIKGIFEAMVGAPLWALAHIRIDGHGLPGQAAMNGYFLIFEVFLRPILIVFGMLASIATYSALVSVMNNVFDLVTQNVAGYDVSAQLDGVVVDYTTAAMPVVNVGTMEKMRGRIDQFFFTIIYAVIVYMMGISSFKLIDTIPNNILRWMGQAVATFGDQSEDAAQGLMSRASMGSQQAVSKLGGGLQTLAGLSAGK